MLSPVRSVHFVGICGTAMASAAAALKEKGFAVTGSDQNVYPPMSTFLASRNIDATNGYAERNLAHKPDLVVIGNAISRGNPPPPPGSAAVLNFLNGQVMKLSKGKANPAVVREILEKKLKV